MTNKPDVTIDNALATFLANGGIIQQIERNVSGQVEGQTYWGMPKKAGRPPADKVKNKSSKEK